MSLNIKTTNDIYDPASLISNSIISKLKEGKRVLFFATGGSSIAVCVKVSELLKNESCSNLVVMLTDERYGPVDHADSNWCKLIKEGFSIKDAKLIPIIEGDSHKLTTEHFNKNLDEELKSAEYKIGMFGIGADGHTAGILPESTAIDCINLACGYDTHTFSRITMTPKAIELLDEAVVWTQGQEKWKVIADLDESDIDIHIEPAQILKKVPLLTIFTDYKKV